MSIVQFIQTTPTQLAEFINEGVKAQLQELKKELVKQSVNDDLLTREETCKFLSVNSSTLWAWTNEGKVKAMEIIIN